MQIRDDEIWVNLASPTDSQVHQRQRLQDGLEQSTALVIAKAVIGLLSVQVLTR